MNTALADRACAELYTGGDTSIMRADLQHVIEQAIANQPRSLQKRIGPSELGTECTRCLVHKLAGTPEQQRDAAWLPAVGTAVHAQLSEWFTDAEIALAKVGDARWLSEAEVNVGTVGGQVITGHADLFDLRLGMVTDFKVVGATTLRDAKANGPSTVYRTQAHLYGKGFADAGYTVQAVGIFYLPRNEPTLANALLWQEPYDQAIADAALARADMYATAIAFLGPEKVLADCPPHTGGHSCARYPDSDQRLPAMPGRAGAGSTAALLNL